MNYDTQITRAFYWGWSGDGLKDPFRAVVGLDSPLPTEGFYYA